VFLSGAAPERRLWAHGTVEMWRNRTPMMKKRALKHGRPTSATVRFLLIGSDSDGDPTWNEVKGEIEVEVPGGPPVVLRGLFNGDKKRAPFVTPGTRLPVALHADTDDKVVIDWGRWDAEGGFAAAKGTGAPDQAAAANAQAYGSTAAPQGAPTTVSAADGPTTSAGGGWQEQSIAGWRAAVAAGRMTEAEFDQAVADLRRATGA